MATRAGEVDRLVAALGDDDPTRRESAIARLRVIGPRALARLSSVATLDAAPRRRSAALKAIDGLDDKRAVDTARAALGDASAEVRIAAIAVLRGWLTREPGAQVLDLVSGVALDPQQEPAIRRAALEALSDLPADIVSRQVGG